jgi:hypothetical protein
MAAMVMVMAAMVVVAVMAAVAAMPAWPRRDDGCAIGQARHARSFPAGSGRHLCCLAHSGRRW